MNMSNKDIKSYHDLKSDENDILIVTQSGTVDVFIQDQYTNAIDLYAYIDKATPSITVDTSIDDKSITVNSIVDVAADDVITIFEDNRIFQSIVSTASNSVIHFASQLDYAFTTDSTVDIGNWNLAVDGSSSPITAHIPLPPSAKWDVYQINISMIDNTVMDSSKFGGIPALANGIVLRLINGKNKNLALIFSNIGFSEQGFDITYDPKPPSGVYGFQAKKNYHITNGISLRLDGSIGDEICLIISDSLGDLTSFDITINAHVVED